MEINDFISNIVNDVTEKAKLQTECRLIDDIIDIYNGRYADYKIYLDVMMNYNDRATKRNTIQIFDIRENNFKLTYTPQKIILAEELFYYIRGLKKWTN